MFTLLLDLHLCYTPPMDEHRCPITFTRTITLPFPPFKGLVLRGAGITVIDDTIGLMLTDVSWDIDRGVFLATTSVVDCGAPLASIYDDLCDWVKRGWKLGSCMDTYVSASEPEEDRKFTAQERREDRHLERQHRTDPRKRPRHLNALVKALARHMAEGYDERGDAYAMDRTGRYFEDFELKQYEGRAVVQDWIRLKAEYAKLGEGQQEKWRNKVLKRPGLAELLAACPRTTAESHTAPSSSASKKDAGTKPR